MRTRWRILLATVPMVIVLDQLSKWLVNRTIPLDGSVPVLPGFFNLVNIRNRGAAFGFLNRSDIDWQMWLFLGATIIACWIIVVLITKCLPTMLTRRLILRPVRMSDAQDLYEYSRDPQVAQHVLWEAQLLITM